MKITSLLHASIATRQIETLVINDATHVNEKERQLLESYTQLRTNYVLQEGWPIHASGVDVDVYDVAAASTYVLAHVGQNTLAGLRLTPISSIYGSLSYSMWQYAIDREEFERRLQLHHRQVQELEAAGGRGMMWDITRLISIGSFSNLVSARQKIESRIAVLKVMSAAAAIAGQHKDSVWIFMCSQRLYDYFHRNHIPFHSLASGTITAGDQSVTHFCYLYPASIIEGLKDTNPMAYRIASKVKKHHDTQGIQAK